MAAAYILRDILQALNYLHNRGIIHRSVCVIIIIIIIINEYD